MPSSVLQRLLMLRLSSREQDNIDLGQASREQRAILQYTCLHHWRRPQCRARHHQCSSSSRSSSQKRLRPRRFSAHHPVELPLRSATALLPLLHPPLHAAQASSRQASDSAVHLPPLHHQQRRRNPAKQPPPPRDISKPRTPLVPSYDPIPTDTPHLSPLEVPVALPAPLLRLLDLPPVSQIAVWFHSPLRRTLHIGCIRMLFAHQHQHQQLLYTNSTSTSRTRKLLRQTARLSLR